MKTLDSILGKFVDLKVELLNFIQITNLDISDFEAANDELRLRINDNIDNINLKSKEIKQANRSIKQINKLIGA